jgi:hypothetical protein
MRQLVTANERKAAGSYGISLLDRSLEGLLRFKLSLCMEEAVGEER